MSNPNNPNRPENTLRVILRDVEGVVQYESPCDDHSLDRVMRQVLSFREELNLTPGWTVETRPLE
jgi:hypothetical protein